MHLLIPFASALSDPAAEVLRDMSLPTLDRLLQRLSIVGRDEADEYTLSPPHERALALAWGWPRIDGALPFAARAAAADGVAVGDKAWGLLTPAHWSVGREHVTLSDPAGLGLDEVESRGLFEAVRPLFESEGFEMAWGSPLRWYAAHASLAGLTCASPDRVIGRNVDLWLRGDSASGGPQRLLRRLQSEVQLLLYPHDINEARESRGDMTVNSFWLSGCGRHATADESVVTVDDTLRQPLLMQDWTAWADAWRALDAGVLTRLLDRVESGASAALTLCGERSAQRLEVRPLSLRQRLQRHWSSPRSHTVLDSL